MKQRGFTLLELMTTIAILGILASIAYSSYVSYMVKTHRTDGQTALFDLATRLEAYYATHHTYTTASVKALIGSAYSQQGYYTLSFNRLTPSAYTLAATPVGTQARQDTTCQTLTLDNLGQKSVAPGPIGTPTGTASQCW